MDKLSAFNEYLPKYIFPPFLRLGCGCLALVLVASGLFIFLVVPSIFAYIVTLDEYPPLEIHLGESLSLEDFTVSLVAMENDTRCLHLTTCSMPGSVDLIFTTSLDDRDYHVTYIERLEGETASDPIALPSGYLLRVMAILATTDADNDLIQFQVFKLPASFTSTR